VQKASKADGGAPTTLATGQATPGYITLGTQHVLWTSNGNGTVMFVAKTGGGLSQVVGSQPGPTGIAFEDSTKTVFFGTNGSDGGVSRVNSDGTGLTSLALGNLTGSVAYDGTTVFFAAYADGVVRAVGKTGGTVTLVASNQDGPNGIALDATYAYWVDFGGGFVMKATKAGGTPITLASGQPGATAVATDDTAVYWTVRGTQPAYTDGRVMKLAK
jgi:hypothetical protein